MTRLTGPAFLNAPEGSPVRQWFDDQCDEHWINEGASCSLWWTVVPEFKGETLGIIGHFEAVAKEPAVEMLQQACDTLAQKGCSMVVGPMNGNTWRKYRLVTERFTEPPFLMEPWNPLSWPVWFQEVGFAPLANYTSLLNIHLDRRDERVPRTLERLQRNGVTIRSLHIEDYENELRRIFSVSSVSFQQNFLYTPITEANFLKLYLPYREKVRPDLVFLAEQGGQTVGYLFAIPDYAQAARGEPITTVVGKTLAILPGREFAGLGAALADLLHQRSLELGFKRVIHALQHESNQVRNMSNHHGEVMRKYTLYSKKLR